MKFGSRMDVFLPLTASLRVVARQRVRGGETIIATLKARS
jgi:phosphatidylserine decarboxylase